MYYVNDPINFAAKIVHEVNRAYCESIGDFSQKHWDAAEEWQRESARAGVRAYVEAGGLSPEEQHAAWVADKEAAGWVVGPVKDSNAKTHPCMIPYAQLPPTQKVKDVLFVAVLTAMEED